MHFSIAIMSSFYSTVFWVLLNQSSFQQAVAFDHNVNNQTKMFRFFSFTLYVGAMNFDLYVLIKEI